MAIKSHLPEKVAILERIDHTFAHVAEVDGYWIRKNRGRIEVRDSSTRFPEGSFAGTYQPAAFWKPMQDDTPIAVHRRENVFNEDELAQIAEKAQQSVTDTPAKVLYHAMRPEFRHTTSGVSDNERAMVSMCWQKGAYKEIARFKPTVGNEGIFKLTNSVHTPWFKDDTLPLIENHAPIRPSRSTSVGDLVVDEATGTAYLVSGFGFKAVDLTSIAENHPPLFLSTPPDLPWYLCQARLDVIRDVGSVFEQDLESYLEIQELLTCFEEMGEAEDRDDIVDMPRPASSRLFEGSKELLETLFTMDPEEVNATIGASELNRPMSLDARQALQSYFEKEREYCRAEHPVNAPQASSGPSM